MSLGIPKMGSPSKINPKKVACFSSLKNDGQLTTFHQQSTTNSPSKNHVQHPVFAKTPSKNHENHLQKKSAELPSNKRRKVWKKTSYQAETRMEVTSPKDSFVRQETGTRADSLTLVGIALAVAVVHLATNGRYGFHRDEFQFLSDARHLDWGFVAYPPFTPLVERLGLQLFGLSMIGLRLFSVIAQALAIVFTGLMAKELGGGRLAQVTAALAVATSALPVFEGTEFQYSSFDYLWWGLIAYFIIRLLKSENPRWWLAIGAFVGLGLMTKYTILFFVAGILGGMVLSPARRYFASAWFWGGVAIALLIFAPNFIWQARHGFISVHFLQHIHMRDVRQGRANGFVWDQFKICANLAAAPLWIAGLIWCLRDRRYRMLGWMYLIPFALFLIGKGRGYYLAAAYPMLLAMGAVAGERWVATLGRTWRLAVLGIIFVGIAAYGVFVYAIIVPLASGGPLKQFALKNNGDLREELGWKEMVAMVAGIRDSLPAEQRSSVGVFTANYGEQGAVEILGPAYGLPMPISRTNSAWLRGYPAVPPTTLIVLGLSKSKADKAFTDCRLAGRIDNPEGVENEERGGSVFVCGPPRLPWAEFWEGVPVVWVRWTKRRGRGGGAGVAGRWLRDGRGGRACGGCRGRIGRRLRLRDECGRRPRGCGGRRWT